MDNTLIITSPSFKSDGKIPIIHTGFGDNISPELNIRGLCRSAISLAITMDDLDVPMTKEFTHWVIWNIPKTDRVPGGIPPGSNVNTLGGAIQGRAYGKNRYSGPKQPFFITKIHRYIFRVYALDTYLDLPPSAEKAELLTSAEGHILQFGSITGTYKRGEY